MSNTVRRAQIAATYNAARRVWPRLWLALNAEDREALVMILQRQLGRYVPKTEWDALAALREFIERSI